ncbi:MAG: hypothetical protein ACT4NU_11565 [Chromatiales bacterium]
MRAQRIRLLARHGHLQYAGDGVEPCRRKLEIGDSVYLNCEGVLFAVRLTEHHHGKCKGVVSGHYNQELFAGREIEFEADDIYVVNKAN